MKKIISSMLVLVFVFGAMGANAAGQKSKYSKGTTLKTKTMQKLQTRDRLKLKTKLKKQDKIYCKNKTSL